MNAPEPTGMRLARALLRVGAPVAAVVAAGASLSALGTRRWDAATRRLVAQLHETDNAPSGDQPGASPPAPPRANRYDPRELVGLPDPVVRFFRAVLTDGQPIVERAEIEMSAV